MKRCPLAEYVMCVGCNRILLKEHGPICPECLEKGCCADLAAQEPPEREMPEAEPPDREPPEA